MEVNDNVSIWDCSLLLLPGNSRQHMMKKILLIGEKEMIIYDYEYIYENLKIRGFTLEYLRNEKILSQSTIQRIRHNDPITTKTIDTICTLIGCLPQDIMRYSRSIADLYYVNALEMSIFGSPVTKKTDEANSGNTEPWIKTVDFRTEKL